LNLVIFRQENMDVLAGGLVAVVFMFYELGVFFCELLPQNDPVEI